MTLNEQIIIDIDFVQLLFLVANIIILYIALKKLLYRPLSNFMQSRTKEIEEGLQVAEENKKRQEQLNQEYEETIQEARKEARQIVEKAYAQSDEIIKEAKKEASQKTEDMIAKARDEIEAEKRKAFEDLKQDIGSISVAIASKIMEKELDEASQEKLVERYLEEVGRAS